MARRIFSFGVFVFLGLWLLLMLGGRSRMFCDPGPFWHLVLGQQMLATGRIVTADSFSFTRYGTPWACQSWLYEVLIALLYRWGGWDALLLLTITCLAGTFAWIAARLRRAGVSRLLATLITVLVVAGAAPQFHVRPLVLSMPLLAACFALLVDIEAGRKSLKSLAWLVPLFVFWTNVHAGALGGLGTLGLVTAGWLVAWILGRQGPIQDRRQAACVLLALAASLASVLVNPYGWRLPALWLSILRMPLGTFMEEHTPLHRTGPYAWLVLLLAVGYFTALLGRSPMRWRSTWLVPPVWLVLACGSNRHAALFAITTAIALADLLPEIRWAPWLTRRGYLRKSADGAVPAPRSVAALGLVVPAALVAASFTLQTAKIPVPIVGSGWVRFDPQFWPVGLLAQLESLKSHDGRPLRIFDDMQFGGYLIYHTPSIQVFLDDRCELYGIEFLRDYLEGRFLDPQRIERWADRYGFRHALVIPGEPLDRYLADSPHWKLLGRCPAASLYEKEGPAHGNP